MTPQRQAASKDPAQRVHHFTYDQAGRLLTYSSSTFDDGGRLTSETNWNYDMRDAVPGESTTAAAPVPQAK